MCDRRRSGWRPTARAEFADPAAIPIAVHSALLSQPRSVRELAEFGMARDWPRAWRARQSGRASPALVAVRPCGGFRVALADAGDRPGSARSSSCDLVMARKGRNGPSRSRRDQRGLRVVHPTAVAGLMASCGIMEKGLGLDDHLVVVGGLLEDLTDLEAPLGELRPVTHLAGQPKPPLGRLPLTLMSGSPGSTRQDCPRAGRPSCGRRRT